MRAALSCCFVIATALLVSGREWTDAVGKFEGEFENCDVIVRLPSGEQVTIPFSDLSEHDRTFVLDELRRMADKDGPAIQPEVAQSLKKQVATLQHQIELQAVPSETKKTLDSIRAADPAFKRLLQMVKPLLDSENPAAVLAALAILGEFKIGDVWLIEKLLSLEREYWRGLPQPVNRYEFSIYFLNDDEYCRRNTEGYTQSA
ncbi:MAG: hypothetical protein H0T51_04640 [Pirellulales bacterium]|nr:hypothetical protein [Pirellulales bacterium]